MTTPSDVFGAPARRFAEDHLTGGSATPSPADRLDQLRGALERWVDPEVTTGTPSEEAERRFVEGAGAFLALLLCDHVVDARVVRAADGSVRLGLGRAGAFDPFLAVEDVLDDPAPITASLRRAIALAEAEHAGRGPVSRVVLGFEAALTAARPGRRIARFDSARVVLDDGTAVELGRVIASTRDEPPPRVRAAVQRLVDALPGAAPGSGHGTGWEDVRDTVVPRLVGPGFLSELGTNQDGLLLTPYREDLRVGFLALSGGRGRFLTRSEAEGWSLDAAEALETALENLRDRSARVRVTEDALANRAGTLRAARSGDALDAARVLLPSFLAGLARSLGDVEDLWIGIPHRDVALAVRGDADRDVLAAFRRRVAADYEAAPHGITPAPFRVTV